MTSAEREIELIIDSTWTRSRATLLAGSPLTMFRVTDAGEQVLAAIERGEPVRRSALVERLLDTGAAHPVSADGGSFDLGDVTVVTPQLGGPVSLDGRIVVDDGSQPPLADATIRLEVNVGPAAARNAGRMAVDTRLVAFVDADVDLLDQLGGGCWLAPLLGHFDDPAVGAVAARVRGEARSPLDLGIEPARVRAGTRVSYVPAAAIVVRLEAFDAVGGFDESLRYGEDVDLVWRLDQAGWTVRYEPASIVWHEPRPAGPKRWRQHARYGSSAAPLALRHPRALSPWKGGIATATIGAAIGFGTPALAVIVGTAHTWRTVRHLDALPRREAIEVVVRGHLGGLGHLARAVRRAWWPLLLLGAIVSCRARRAAIRALVITFLVAPRESVNDVAYSTGVWRSVFGRRTVAPLVPRIVRWTTS